MGGMMGGGPDPNLKKLEPGIQVKAITYCRGTYRVTTADGKTRNLRFRTDSSKDGPEKDAPAITPAGMMGDSASVIFAAPEEMTKVIEAMLIGDRIAEPFGPVAVRRCIGAAVFLSPWGGLACTPATSADMLP
jgi:hypothetical protein